MQVTKVVWEFLIALPVSQRKYYKTSLDFRIKNKEEIYKRVLQQNTALQTDRVGNIVLLLMVVSDISHLKKETGISAAIISTKNDGFLVWDASDTHLNSQIAFSRREREIIKLLAEGFSSREVAERLSVSEYTVSTHRRNMLKKTRLSNTRALVRFAINHGMI
jgi:DNA-binding NarL/FixJ family response regulator